MYLEDEFGTNISSSQEAIAAIWFPCLASSRHSCFGTQEAADGGVFELMEKFLYLKVCLHM